MALRNSEVAVDLLLRELAQFRFTLRGFLHFSEEAATRVGLTPQQHQMMLQVAGAPAGTLTTIAYLAERMVLRHHSVVELSGRCEDAGLVVRKADASDGRLVVLELTDVGRRVLRELSEDHARELKEMGPRLIRSLEAFTG